MKYGNDENHSLLLRFLPVCIIQFGMSGLGVLLVMRKNKETFTQYGLVKKNMWKSILACLLVSIPTVIFLFFTDELHGFLPFQGMFLTDEILNAMFPFNVLGYCVIALVWGFGEGFFYVVLADKLNSIYKPDKLWNVGAFTCVMIAIAIHGMIGFDMITLLEALTTFLLMYGSLLIYKQTGNAWGNILIFFVIWNAL